MEFADQFYRFPEVAGNPEIAAYLTDQYEFARLKTGETETYPLRGKPFKHQRIIMQLMLFAQSMLLVHATGSGKTCTSIDTVEQFKETFSGAIASFIQQYIQPKTVPYKRIVIMVRGPILKADMERQIICKCTAKGVYDTAELRAAQTDNMRSRVINRALSPYYEIVTYDKFLSDVGELINRDKYPESMSERDKDQLYQNQVKILKRQYDHTIFIADEIHILTTEKKEETVTRYKNLHHLLHILEGTKVLLMSATPMKNRGVEIADILNLLLPLDQQISPQLIHSAFPPADLEIDEEKVKKVKTTMSPEEARKQLEPYFQGRISYIRAMDIGVDIVDEHPGGEDIYAEEDIPSFWIMPVPLRGEQARAYIKAKAKREDKRNNDIYAAERQLSNGWFPGERNQAISRLFSNYFKQKRNLFEPKDPKFHEAYFRPRGTGEELPPLALISPKTVAIGEMLRDPRYAGKMMVYSNYKDMGAYLVAVGLQFVYGFEPYDGGAYFQEVSTGRGYCGNRAVTSTVEREPLRGITKKPRYGLLIPSNRGRYNADLLNIFNSYENRHGEYIRVLITSQVGREGINTNEVRTYVNFDGHWNNSSYHQALSRVLRSDAYLWSRSEREERIQLNVVNLAAVLDPDALEADGVEYDESILEEPEIDAAMYFAARAKSMDIERVMRFIKETAVDCELHKNRNLREKDVDGSSDCNYQTCAYSCRMPIPPTGDLHYTTYDLLFSQEEIEEIQEELLDILRSQTSVRMSELTVLLSHHRPVLIAKAVQELVRSRRQITDRMGFRVYVKEWNGTVNLQRYIPVDATNDYSLDEYSRRATLTSQRDLRQLSIQRFHKKVVKWVEKDKPVDLKNLNVIQRIMMLEEMYIRHLEGKDYEYLSKYLNRIYTFDEPTQFLKEQAESSGFGTRMAREGGKIQSRILPEVQMRKYRDWEGGGDKVHVHALLYLKSGSEFERYNNAGGVIRVYRESEGYWRDANDYEDAVYTLVLQTRVHDYNKSLGDVYGFYIGERFKVYDVNMESKEMRKAHVDKKTEKKTTAVDLRKRIKGMDCLEYLKKPGNQQRASKALGVPIHDCEDLELALNNQGKIIYLDV